MKQDKGELSNKFQDEEPEVFDVEPVTDFDSFFDRLQEAEADYKEACETFRRANPGSETIMKTAEIVERAAKALASRVQVIFLMQDSSAEERAHAREVLDMLTKDSCRREKTCSNLYRKVREAHPDQTDRINDLLIDKQKRMKFLDRCMATQAHYQKDLQNGKDAAADELKRKASRSYRAERIRRLIPAGGRFCPPRIFPHDPIPEGRPVPYPPEPIVRFHDLEPEDLIFNPEQHNFEISPNYLSEDGKMDGESVVWDYENHKVVMKYRGEEPVTWDFRQYIDRREVPKAADWDVQYYDRLRNQYAADRRSGILLHRQNEEK